MALVVRGHVPLRMHGCGGDGEARQAWAAPARWRSRSTREFARAHRADGTRGAEPLRHRQGGDREIDPPRALPGEHRERSGPPRPHRRVAALNVGGQTIHRFFGFGIDATPEKVQASRTRPRHPELYRKLSTIVIDEVSMLRADLLDCIDLFLRKYGPKRGAMFAECRWCSSADLYQLHRSRPVTSARSSAPSTRPRTSSAPGRSRDADLEIVELEKVYRQKDADLRRTAEPHPERLGGRGGRCAAQRPPGPGVRTRGGRLPRDPHHHQPERGSDQRVGNSRRFREGTIVSRADIGGGLRQGVLPTPRPSWPSRKGPRS